VLDPVDENSLRLVVDPIEDAIISNSETITLVPGQFEAAGGTRVLGQGPDFLEDSFKHRHFEPVEVFLRRGEDEEFIHGAF
jgi:hypothetical protein